MELLSAVRRLKVMHATLAALPVRAPAPRADRWPLLAALGIQFALSAGCWIGIARLID